MDGVRKCFAVGARGVAKVEPVCGRLQSSYNIRLAFEGHGAHQTRCDGLTARCHFNHTFRVAGPLGLLARRIGDDRRRLGGLEIEKLVAIRRALAFDEQDIAGNAKTAGAGNAACRVDEFKVAFFDVICGQCFGELTKRRAFSLVEWQGFAVTGIEAAHALLDRRALVEKFDRAAGFQAVDQGADDASRSFTLDPTRLAAEQFQPPGLNKIVGKFFRVFATQFKTSSCDVDTGRQAHDIPRHGRQRALVVVVDVEIGQAIVAKIGAEIFKMQIAANPSRRTARI